MNPSFPECLDPADWSALRQQGHRMLDDMFDHMEGLREQPVWRPIPAVTRAAFQEPLPRAAGDLTQLHGRFMSQVVPYAVGNAHPGFMGWVHGGGTAIGMLAEMAAAGLNANCGGRDHMPLEVERQVVRWMRELFGFPEAANGLFVTGSSMANLLGVLVARTRALGIPSRESGLGDAAKQLVAYASAGAHRCISQALSIAGLGTQCLRLVPVNERHEMDLSELSQMIMADRRAGREPFLLVGSAGTVDVGAIDDLSGAAAIARRENVWFHVDGAMGALGMLSPEIAPRLRGIEQADSIALDFHKWGQVQYDAGFILVRDGTYQLDAFSAPVAYLARQPRGLAAGPVWPCDLGPDLSRGFRALKVWFTLGVYGADRLGATIARSCAVARHLAQRIIAEPELELMAPVALNIVCFRFRCSDADRVNSEIVQDLHESGLVAPSATSLPRGLAIRAAIVNHRTRESDADTLVNTTVLLGRQRTES
jgi:aromatic-L-amino-acid decarboxylase